MHISEGIISGEIATITLGVVVSCIAFLVYRAKEEMIGKIALISSLFFVVSIIHIPIGATNIHLMLLGVVGVYLGIYSIIAIFIALLLQALLLGYGGISSLGINTINMTIGAICSYYMYEFFKYRINNSILYFLIGFISVAITSFALSLSLFLAHSDLIKISSILFSFNLSLSIIEGIINLFIFKFLQKVGKI